MNDTRLDQLLRQSLASEQPKPELNQTLHTRMEAAQASGKAGIPMKHRRMKKALVLAAALCAAFAVAATAYTTLTVTIGSSSTHGEFTSFQQLPKAEKKAGFTIHAVEAFSNGYVFQEMDIAHMQDEDENGNVLREYKGIDIEYAKGENTISLSTERQHKDNATAESRKPDATRTIDDITISYHSDTYKFVPPDYELTDEDRANEKKDNYFISYGSDEVEETVMAFAIWVQDGVEYCLISDTNTSSDQLFSMAQELIAAK